MCVCVCVRDALERDKNVRCTTLVLSDDTLVISNTILQILLTSQIKETLRSAQVCFGIIRIIRNSLIAVIQCFRVASKFLKCSSTITQNFRVESLVIGFNIQTLCVPVFEF